ncbi:hypothetical protein K438DRAFT_1977816 [Mycena galopus ATCC 62051]|nr:hypothetical protein K438DRAFT_1977816 [Mycena galopus ATCC 62051]
MNKHGIVLDFGKREIRFPNNRVIKALSTIEEASLLSSPLPLNWVRAAPIAGHNTRAGPTAVSIELELEETPTLPSLPTHCPYLLIPESDFRDPSPSFLESLESHHPTEESDPHVEEEPIGDPNSYYQGAFSLRDGEPPIYFHIHHHDLHAQFNHSGRHATTPGLRTIDYVTMHSSATSISRLGDVNPYHLNAIALEGAIDLVRLHSTQVLGELDYQPAKGMMSRTAVVNKAVGGRTT